MAKILQPRYRKEKGLTLVEVVVSLAVISIISIAVLTLVMTSTSQMRNATVARYFNHEINEICNLYLTYTYGDEDSDYKEALTYYTGVENSETYYYSSSFTYVTSEENYSYYVTLDYNEDELGNSQSLTIKAYYHSDNKIIVQKEVSK